MGYGLRKPYLLYRYESISYKIKKFDNSLVNSYLQNVILWLRIFYYLKLYITGQPKKEKVAGY